MRINQAKQKMLEGKPAFGYAMGLGSPDIAEIMSHCGIDYLLMDTQHGNWSQEATSMALAAMRWGSAIPMARVAANRFHLIGRLLDEGMLGLVIPMVNTLEDAKAVAWASHYPPLGGRSCGGSKASVYGGDYLDWIDDQLFVAVQIETIEAAGNAEQILSVPGIDGCWIGPADLALSMGFPPKEQTRHPEHARAIEQVLEACHKTGKIPGIACGSPEDALARAAQGFLYVTAGADAGMLQTGMKAGLETLGMLK